MSPDCSVCTRPDLEAVNAALLSDESLRAIADRFGIPKTTLLRHREHAPGASDRADDADHCGQCGDCTCSPSPEASTEPQLSELPASGLIASLDAEIAAAETERDQRRARIADLAAAYVDTRSPEAFQALDQANAEASRADALLVAMKGKRAEEAERLRVQLEQEQAEHETRMTAYRQEERLQRLAVIANYNELASGFPVRLVETLYPRLRDALQNVLDIVAEGEAMAEEVSKAHATARENAQPFGYGPDRPHILPPPTHGAVVQLLLERVPNLLAGEFLAHAPSYQEGSALQMAAMIVVPRRIQGPWQRKGFTESFE